MAGVPAFPATGGVPYTPPSGAAAAPAPPADDSQGPAGSSAAPPPMPPANGPAANPSAPPAFPSTGGLKLTQPPAPKPKEPGLLRDVGAGVVKGLEGVKDFGAQALDFVTSPTGLDPMATLASTIFGPGPKPSHLAEDIEKRVPTPAPVASAEKWANATHPQTYLGAAAQGAGELLPFAAMPAGGEGLAGRTLAQGKQLLGTTAIGGLSGAGAKAGSDVGQTVAGPQGAQTGAVVGSLLGAGLPVAGALGAAKLSEALGEVVPATKGAQARVARSVLTRAEPNVAAARQRVADKLTPSSAATEAADAPRGPDGEILPGSLPTTAAMAGSPGLARLHEVMKASGQGDVLKEAEEQQAAARANAVRQIGPADKVPPAQLREEIQNELKARDLRASREQNAAEKGLEKATAAQPGLTTSETPYQVGSDLQASIASGEGARKTMVSSLFGKLDDKNPMIDMAPLSDSVKGIQAEGERSKAEFPAELNHLLTRADELGQSPDTTWAQVQELRASINQAIEQSKANYGQNTPLTRRLSQLKSGVDSALEDSISKMVGNEDEPLSPGPDSGPSPAGPARGDEPTGHPAVPDAGVAPEGAEPGEGDGGLPAAVSGQPAADEGAVGDGAASARLEPGDARLYRRALSLHAETKQLYQNPVIGPILARSRGQLALAPEKVIDRLVAPGSKGGEVARAVKNLAQDNPGLLQQYDTAIGLSLRKAAMTPDGLDPRKFQSWVGSHEALIRSFPTLGKRFSSIKEAQQAVEDAVEKRKLLQQAYDLKAFRSVTAGEDPSVAMTHLLNGTPTEARTFMKRLNPLPSAKGAARTAMAEHLASTLLEPMAGDQTGAEAVRISTIKSLLRNSAKRQVISEVLGPQAIRTLDRVVKDASANNMKSLSGIGVGQSGTTPLREGIKGLKGPHTMLGFVLQQLATPVGAAVSGGLTAPLSAMGAEGMAGAFRFAQNTQQAKAISLLARAMVDPKVYLELTKPMPRSTTAVDKFLRRMRYTVASSYIEGSSHASDRDHGQP